MAVNKVEYGDTTLIDLTSDTVTKETLLIGATAHTASGESISGEFDPEIYLRKSGGDTTNNIVTFTSGDSTSPTAWTNVDSLVTGEKHSSLLNKISTMIKNVRFLYKVLGTTDISTIGDGTVTGAVSTLNSSLNEKLNWTLIGTINASNPTINIPSEYNDIALLVLHSNSGQPARKVYSKITLNAKYLEEDLLETRYNIANPNSSFDITARISRTQVSLGDNIRSISVYGR